jgi:ribosomal-protein-alanine N-acetyltransferase
MITPILETERLILRPLKLSDVEAVYNNWTSDENVAKYMVWDVHKDINETKEWIECEVANLESDKNYTWGIVLKETEELIGSISLLYKEEINCYSLGYNIMKKYWGQGITTEAGREVINFGENELNQKKFYCRHANENIASMKVMTKLGFKYHAESEYDSFSGSKHFEAKEYYLILQ